MRKSIKKILSLIVASSTIFGLTSICANAEWRQDSTGWWYTEGDTWSTGWRQIDSKWYYFDNNGYMKTGWMQDNSGKWYYLYSDGSMASNTSINGYVVNENGIWYKTEPSTNNITTQTANNSIKSDNSISVKSDSSSSESSSGNSSSSSRHHSSDSDSSNKAPDTLVSVFYKLNDLTVTRMGEGKQSLKSYYGDELSKKAEIEATYGMILVDSKDFGATPDVLMDEVMVNKNYKLINDNGSLKLVKKTTDNNASKSDSSSTTTQTTVREPVVTPTQTTGSAVAMN